VTKAQPRQGFHVDHDRRLLWILHRKNASGSIQKAIGSIGGCLDTEALPYNHYHTITLLRHPWDRLTSGLYNPFGEGPRAFRQTLQEEILNKPHVRMVDRHLWPQWYMMDGFRVDRTLIYERIEEDWAEIMQEFGYPELEWQNEGFYHNWRKPDWEPFDWSVLNEWYEQDFELCADWEKK
jgi:hypothetical protein